MIVRISMKLLLIGIIKNNKRGSFVLAVISFAPASETIEETITAQEHGLAVIGSPYFDVVGGPIFRACPEKVARFFRFRHAPTR
ncbi:MAG: hypothetical protein ACR2KT_15415 [Methylocella sp.]